MNDNILCLYYSRTGNTKKAMEEVAEALDCECLEIRDKVDRSGTMGYLRCCFDAMHKRTSAVSRPKCQKPLSDYKLVILGTPVWAGRCSSVIRGFLKRRGYEIQNAAYLITHKSEPGLQGRFPPDGPLFADAARGGGLALPRFGGLSLLARPVRQVLL